MTPQPPAGNPERSGMTPERWQRLKSLFDEALARPSIEHAAYVEQIRSEDSLLADHLNSLIRGHLQPTSPIDQPLFQLDRSPTRRPSFADGDLVINRFQIVRILGMGGMGEVYEAKDLELGRIALKTIRPEIAAAPNVLARFKQEVALARRISGPHVCRIHEFFVTESRETNQPVAFLTMEYLEGVTLSTRLRGAGPLSWAEARDIAIQLCDGLTAIHQAGIVHRDLKSRNIMLVPRGAAVQAVVMDFGLATESSGISGPNETGITAAGAVVGTPEYMAPEQFEGKPLTPAADIYALGIVLYEMATANHPFSAPTPLAAAMRRAKRPPPVASIRKDVPRHWDRVIDKCLEYEADQRFQTAAEVAAALKSGIPEKTRRGPLIAALAVAALLIVAIAALYLTRPRPYHTKSPEAQSWYDRGVEALREGSYLAATRELARAVQFDPDFALAHARLAEAWGELEFKGKADHEMVHAFSRDVFNRLSATDRLYIEAVRNTMLPSYAVAVNLYREILDALPESEKTYGLVDLGRAYEKAGKIEDAIATFELVRKRSPEYAAPYVHLGILEGHRKHSASADAAFTKAKEIYDAANNIEGLAEVNYQLGYSLNTRGTRDELAQARAALQQSLDNAKVIRSVELETRAITALSTNAYSRGNSAESEKLAMQAIELANSNQLEYWSIDALVRLGTAYFTSADFEPAESSFSKALKLAQTSQRPRLEALSSLALASLRDQQNRPAEVVPLAQTALDFYRPHGFFEEAGDSLTLLNRAMLARGEFSGALESGRELVQNATALKDTSSMALAEETLGQDLFSLTQYPEALAHFHSALDLSRKVRVDTRVQIGECAEALACLGRYQEADSMLSQLPAAAAKLLEVVAVKTHELLSREKYSDVIRIASQALGANQPNPSPRAMARLYAMRGIALARLGQIQEAEQSCADALAIVQKRDRKDDIAEANLALASVYLASPNPERAKPLIESARDTFVASHRLESHWLSIYSLARYYHRVGAPEQARAEARKSLDILSDFQHTWSTMDRNSYQSRPDVLAAISELNRL